MKIKTLLLLLTWFGMSGVVAQSFYDVNTIQEIKVSFYQPNWYHLLDSLKTAPGDSYLLVPSVEINGEVFDSVGVKYKGYSSYDPGNLKNPIHIELNHFKKGQNYQGVKDIKLSNVFYDPTFVREVLSYEILRKYMDEPLANYAKLWLDGEYWGVYVNVESVSKPFLRKHFHTDGDNPFFKCNPTDVAGTNGHADLKLDEDHITDSVFYYNRYEMKSDYGWAQFLGLMDTLTNYPNKVHRVIDVDRALWMLAFNNVFVNLDSYTGVFAQNYYLYQDKNDRWLPVVWDLNMCFGGFNNLDGSQLMTVQQMKQLDPLAQANNSFRPLIQSLLENPTYKRMYLAHMRTILQENFATTMLYLPRIQQLQTLISAAVQADDKKFYSDTQFITNVNQAVNQNDLANLVPGITDLMTGRYNYLINNANFTATPPAISNVSDLWDGEVYVTANVTNATTVTLYFRYDSSAIFQSLQMWDDGQHQDGTAGDGKYGQSFPYNGIVGQYYVYAENANAGMFSPQRAEHEFYTATLNPPPPPFGGDLVINEFLASNTNAEVDEAGQHEDWIELYNNSNNAISMSGLYLTDNPAKPDKWLFPLGTTIPAKGFLIVWADEDQSQGPLHASFKLSAAGEFLMLSNGATGVIDSVSFGQQLEDKTYGRYPNGTGPFVFMQRTFNAVNSPALKTSEPWEDTSLQIFPNPVFDNLSIISDQPLGLIRVSDVWGQQVLQVDKGNDHAVLLSMKNLPAGVYCVMVGERTAKVVQVLR